jgi:hypothetical protein
LFDFNYVLEMYELVIAKEDDTAPFESEDKIKKINSPKERNYQCGEKVKIKSIKKECMDPEDYYYLKKFENRTGMIAEQKKCQSGIYTYKIEFAQNNFGYFYHEDFILINEEKPK